MKEAVRAICGGVAVGIANVIPGVSGGTLMVIMGIFDRTMEAISGVFKKKNDHRLKDIVFLLEVLVGMGVAILAFAKLLDWLFGQFAMPTICWFLGLVALSVPVFKKSQMKGISVQPLALACGAAVVLALTAIKAICFPETGTADSNEALPVFSALLCGQLGIAGVISGFAMLLPGVSGSLMLMILGMYELVVFDYVGNISYILKNLSFEILVNLVPLGVFAVGVVIGIVLSAKLTALALRKDKRATLSFLMGLVAASTVSIVWLNLDDFAADAGLIVASVLSFAVGGAIVLLLGKLQKD